MERGGLFCLLLALVACSPAISPEESARRVVSLDYCADQYVLQFVDPDEIAALSPDATKSFSYLRDRAAGLPQIRPRAEEVLALRPTLIVRSYGGGPGAQALFERAGVPVVQIGFANDLATIREVTLRAAEDLGASQAGQTLVAQMDERLGALALTQTEATALYLTPGGVTAGTGTLIDEMLTTAGLANFQTAPGWHSLPLEQLALEQPDIAVPAFFESAENNQDAWSAARHPIARAQMEDRPAIALQGAWTSCGGWYLLGAIEALADGAAELERGE